MTSIISNEARKLIQEREDNISPAHYKVGGLEDLKKAQWFLNKIIAEMEGDKNNEQRNMIFDGVI